MRRKYSRKKSRFRLGLLFLCCGIGCWLAANPLGKNDFSLVNTVEQPLRIGIIGELEGLQPSTIQSLAEKIVGSLSFEALTYYDQTQQQLVPQLAESWEFSPDAYTLTFQIKEGVQFQNGRKLTAADIKMIWEKNFLTGENWKNYHLIRDIEGSEAFLNGAVTEITGIKAKKNQLQITFEKPNTLFPYIVTHPLFWIADPENEEGIPAGTGPYIIQDRNEQQIVLTPFQQYRDGFPQLQKIEIHRYENEEQAYQDFQQGKLDVALPLDGKTAEQFLEENSNIEVLHRQPILEYYLLGFHQGMSPFAGNAEFRQSLNYMIDREKIIQEITGPGFIPAKGPIPQGISAYRPQVLGYTYDPEQAQNLLDQSGYTGKNDTEGLLLSYHTGSGHRLVLEEIQRQMQSFGVQIQLREADWDAYCYQLPRMGYSFFRLSWQADYPDADDFLYSLYHSSNLGITNYTGFQNSQVDALLDQARATIDEEKRIHLQQQAEDIILDQAPQLWLFQREMLSLVSTELEGMTLNVSGFPQWATVHFSSSESSKKIETS